MTSEPESSKGLPRLIARTKDMLSVTKQQGADRYLKLADVTALRALIQAIPYVGSSLDTLIFDKAEKIRRRRILEYLDALHEYMRRIDADKMDKRFFKTEQGLSVFEMALRVTIGKAVKEERKVLAAFTVGAGLKHLSSRDDHLFVLECVARMSISQIVVLLELAEEQWRIAKRWGLFWYYETLRELHYTDVVERAERALKKWQLVPKVSIAEILDGLMSMNLIAHPEMLGQDDESGGTYRFDCLSVTHLGGSVYQYLYPYYAKSGQN